MKWERKNKSKLYPTFETTEESHPIEENQEIRGEDPLYQKYLEKIV